MKITDLMYFFYLLQLHNLAESERGTKSKTRQNLELSAKNKELTQSLKQLHQSFLASNQVRSNFQMEKRYNLDIS